MALLVSLRTFASGTGLGLAGLLGRQNRRRTDYDSNASLRGCPDLGPGVRRGPGVCADSCPVRAARRKPHRLKGRGRGAGYPAQGHSRRSGDMAGESVVSRGC